MGGVSRPAVMNRLGRGGFLRNVLVVMSGTAVAQLIGFAFSPVLSRLYDPVHFGLFGAYMSVVSVIGAATTFNYTDALMLPKRGEEAAALFLVACLAAGLITLGTALICLVAPVRWFDSFGIGEISSLIWLLPVSVFLFGANLALTAWCSRLKAFSTTSRSQVLRSMTVCAAQTGGGVAKLGGTGLIAAVVVAEFATLMYMGKRVLAQSGRLLRDCARWSLLCSAAKEYREFAIYGTPQKVMNALSQGIPVLLLAHYYGAAVAGSYAFGIRLLQAPMNFVLTSVRQVLYQKLSQIKADGGDLYPPFLKSTGILIGISIVPASLGFLVAPPLFAFVFGEEWREAGEFGRWLIIWLIPMFCNVPAALSARILRLQRDLFLLDVLLLSSRATALILGGMWLRSIHTIIALSMVGAVFNLVFIGYVTVRVKASRTESQ